LLLALSLFVSFAPAQQPAECPFGVNAHMADDASLQLAADAGVGWVRMDFNWYQLEPSPGVYEWGAADRFIDSAVALGLNVYPTIAYAPAWAVAPGCDDTSDDPAQWCRNQSPDPVAWASFVTAAVDRYGDRVKVWGLWNEPNLEHFYRDTRSRWVSDVLVPGAEAVHATCADCQVAGPELANLREASWDADAGLCVLGECVFNGWEVSLAEILDEAGSHIDIVTHHKYDDSAEVWLDELIAGQWLGGVQYMHGLKELTDDHAPGKPVWVTEYGWETTPGGPYDPAYAADQLTDSYLALDDVQAGGWGGHPAWPELDKLFWYDLQDDPVVHEWGQFTWGLLDADGQPKEAYDAYADVISSLGGCEAYAPGATSPAGVDSADTADTGSAGPPLDTGSADDLDSTSGVVDTGTSSSGGTDETVPGTGTATVDTAAELTQPQGAGASRRKAGCSTVGNAGGMAGWLALAVVWGIGRARRW